MYQSPAVSVLIIEDNLGDVRLIQEYLVDFGSEFSFLVSGELQSGIQIATANKVDITLLDLGLPDSYGMETLLTFLDASPEMPVVILTGNEDLELAQSAVKHGAQDLLVKQQINTHSLYRSMVYAIERKRAIREIEHMANHDGLTGLPNRQLFEDRLKSAIKRAKRNRGDNIVKWEFAVMMLDLDEFKSINDTFGHDQGDVLLTSVAERLTNLVRQTDTVARMGGDEFILIFENQGDLRDTELIARKVLTAFEQPFQLKTSAVNITPSIGVCHYPQDGEDLKTLIKHADIAMYQAKTKKNKFIIFSNLKYLEINS